MSMQERMQDTAIQNKVSASLLLDTFKLEKETLLDELRNDGINDDDIADDVFSYNASLILMESIMKVETKEEALQIMKRFLLALAMYLKDE